MIVFYSGARVCLRGASGMHGGNAMEQKTPPVAPLSLGELARFSGRHYKTLYHRAKTGLLKPVAFTPDGKARYAIEDALAIEKLPKGRPSNRPLEVRIAALEEQVAQLLEASGPRSATPGPDSNEEL
jgi:hypothetical protein